MTKYYPQDTALCISCYYARMRTDICGIYCTKGFVKDGKCDMFLDYEEKKRRKKLIKCVTNPIDLCYNNHG